MARRGSADTSPNETYPRWVVCCAAYSHSHVAISAKNVLSLDPAIAVITTVPPRSFGALNSRLPLLLHFIILFTPPYTTSLLLSPCPPLLATPYHFHPPATHQPISHQLPFHQFLPPFLHGPSKLPGQLSWSMKRRNWVSEGQYTILEALNALSRATSFSM